MITIAHIVDLPGSNAWLNGIVDHCDRLRFRHLVIQLKPRNGLHEALEARGVEALSLDITSRRQYPLGVARMAAMLRKRRVDIVQTHLFEPTSVGLAAARLARTPLAILTRHHADFTTLFDKPIHRRIDRWHALFADQVWCPSHFIKKCMVELEGVPPGKITVLPLAFNFEAMKPSLDPAKRRALREEMGGDDKYIIGMVARLSVEKGHEYLLRAVADVVRKHPNVRLALIGEGPRRGEIERLIAELRISEYVRLLGWRWDAWNLIEAMDLYAHSSVREPFGIVYVESMAMEKAIVTTSESGAVEILDDGVTGLIVPPRSVEPLAAAISQLVADPARCKQMGIEGRRRAIAKYAFPKMIREYEQHWERWLSERTGRSYASAMPSASAR